MSKTPRGFRPVDVEPETMTLSEFYNLSKLERLLLSSDEALMEHIDNLQYLDFYRLTAYEYCDVYSDRVRCLYCEDEMDIAVGVECSDCLAKRMHLKR